MEKNVIINHSRNLEKTFGVFSSMDIYTYGDIYMKCLLDQESKEKAINSKLFLIHLRFYNMTGKKL